ncbi:EAL domain-containing protein [Catenovulum sediminis]|uniref:EAL domain-containing protein n=1 Tax=Catenovulum sediminis TaxID=1740262 RepID=UPI00117BE700|nr:EAL domain-containing protein [Catenovulum sediminis]
MNRSFTQQYMQMLQAGSFTSSQAGFVQRLIHFVIPLAMLSNTTMLAFKQPDWSYLMLVILSGLCTYFMVKAHAVKLVTICLSLFIGMHWINGQTPLLILVSAVLSAFIGCAAQQYVKYWQKLKQKAERASASINLCEALLRTNQHCIKLLDLDGQLQVANADGLSLLKSGELAQGDWQLWLSQQAPEQRKDIKKAWLQAINEGYGEMSGPLNHGEKRGYWRIRMARLENHLQQSDSVLVVTQDISELVFARQKAETVNAELVAMLDSLNALFIAFDPKHSILFSNSKARSYMRTVKNSLNQNGGVASNLSDSLPEFIYVAVEQCLKQINDEQIQNTSIHIQEPTLGRWLDVEIWKKENGYNLFVTDIHERYLQQQQNKQALLVAELVQELESVGSWEYDISSRRISLSVQAQKILDVQPTRIANDFSLINCLLNPNDKIKLTQAFLKASQGEENVYVYAQVKHQSGDLMEVRFALRCLYAADSSPEKIIGSVQDITEQKARESYLKEAERMVRGIIDALPNQICVIDEQGTVINTNHCWQESARNAGADESLIGRGCNYLAVCHRSEEQGCCEAGEVGEGIRMVISGDRDEFQLEYSLPVNEELKWFNIRVAPLGSNSQKLKLFVISHEDVTAMKTLVLESECQREQLSMVLEATEDGIWDWQLETGSTYYSPNFFALLGLAPQPMPNFSQWLSQSVAIAQRDDVMCQLSQHIEQHNAQFDIDCKLQKGNGEYHWFRLRGRGQFNDNVLVRFVGTLMDIGDYQHLLEQLGEKERQFQDLAERIPDVFWDYDLETSRFRYVSPAFEQIWQVPLSEIEQADFGYWINSLLTEDRERVKALFDNIIVSGNSGFVEYRILTGKGDIRWISTRCFVVKDDDGQVLRMVGTSRDVTQSKLTLKKLKEATELDSLTGLPNRSTFMTLLQEKIKQDPQMHQRFALVFIDIDRLMTLNDSVGHEIGDQLLQHIAGRLLERSHKEGTLARIGGDEFAMTIPMEDSHLNLTAMLSDMVASFNTPFLVEQHSLFISASIGAAIYPRDGISSIELMRNADYALNEVKHGGGGGYRICPHTVPELSTVIGHLESELRLALDENQFELFYQAKVSAGSGTPLGCEALLRWRHPQHGIVPPLSFISRLENSGLIIPVGEHVLQMGLKQLKKWHQQGYTDMRMALNISPRQLLEPGFVKIVEKALNMNQVDSQSVELELTESALVSDPELAADVLSQLKLLGISIAIDDFGTGYSSLSYLHMIKPDIVKIDKGFVENIEKDEEACKLLDGVISLCRHLNIETVAEGVELECQWDLLRKIGCQTLQGYLFSKPLPADDFAREVLAVSRQAQQKCN